MARTRDVSLIDRDARIVAAVAEGKRSYQEISEEFGVSKARVAQIVKRFYEELPDEDARHAQRAKLEEAQRVMFEIMRGKGKRVVSPGGSPVFERNDDGTINYDAPLYDEEIRIKAALAATTIGERLARSGAWDLAKQKQKDESPEFAEAMAYLETLSKENKDKQHQLELLQERLAQIEAGEDVVEAEVIEEENELQDP